MTDIVEKIAEVEKYNMALKLGLDALVIDLDENAEEDANRILSAIREDFHLVPKNKPESIVRELEWGGDFGDQANDPWGGYYIGCEYKEDVEAYRWCHSSRGDFDESDDTWADKETAKDEANKDHAARVLSLLNLEESE